MVLKAHLFGWTIIQKGLTNTWPLSKFISMFLLIVHLLNLSTENKDLHELQVGKGTQS
jgi:hypothetical protein